MADDLELQNPELLMLINNKLSGFNYRERRQDDWTENYTLYRDKVQYNRLIQRQTVNLPLMKTMLLTLLKDVDDMPNMIFKDLGNDAQKEIFKNEYWKYTGEQNKFEVQDIVDKKQQFHFGRTFDQWQIVDGKIKMTIQAPDDILVDRYCDPTNLNTSRFLIHEHVFVPLSALKKNAAYDQEAVSELEKWFATEMGLIKAADNQASLQRKNEKLADLGLSDVDAPILGETIVELALHFVFREEGKEEDQIWHYVEAEQQQILLKKKLEDVIDPDKNCKDHFWRNHYPYNTWASDIERQDFWSDGVADTIRTSNKILNTWFSQMVENRTLRNFGMNYYDSTLEGFSPQTYDPIPGGWYGIPVPTGGNIDAVMKKVDIPDLGGKDLQEMNFIIALAEKASGATATQQGTESQKQITLGEVKLALDEAKERIKGMSKFYTQVWKERGLMFIKLLEAAPDKIDAVTVYKKGRNSDKMYSREIGPDDWKSEVGYMCEVWSQDEKDAKNTNAIEKLNATAQFFPNNTKFRDIQQRKLLEFDGLNPDEINDVMQIEQQNAEMIAAQQQALMTMGPGGQPMPPGTPGTDGLAPQQPQSIGDQFIPPGGQMGGVQ